MFIFYFRRTALHSSIAEKNEPLFNVLIDSKNVNLNLATTEGHSPLCFALRMEPFHKTFAEKLLAKGASPNPVYPLTGDTLLHILARDGREEAAIFLIEHSDGHSWKANLEGFTVLHEACNVGLSKLARLLLKTDSSAINACTTMTLTTNEAPIHLAVSNLYLDVVQALLEAGGSEIQLDVKDKDGETPLSLAIKAPFKKGREIAAALINAGANINQRNEQGLTLLHQAILKEDSAMAIFLLENGADMNMK